MLVQIKMATQSGQREPEEVQAMVAALKTDTDNVTATAQRTKQQLLAMEKTLEDKIQLLVNTYTQETNQLAKRLEDYRGFLAELNQETNKNKSWAAAVQEVTTKIAVFQEQLDAKNQKLTADTAVLEKKSQAIQTELETAKGKSINVWYVANGLMHLADRMLDRTVDGWSQVGGVIISIIANTVTSLHAIAVSIAATGPQGFIQAGIIVASNIVSTSSQIQAAANIQALKQNRDYNAEIENNYAPW